MNGLEKLQNEQDQILRWPKKNFERVLILDFLISKFDANRTYHELEINEIIKQWHTFQDWSGLRRELIVRGYMNHNTDGTEYHRLS